MTWTEQKIQMLKDMWGHHSASEIAEQIGGLTRNAVIGKAHRLKLSTQKSSEGGVSIQRVSGGASSLGKTSRKRVLMRTLPVVPPSSSAVVVRQTPPAKDIFRSLEGISGAARGEGIAVTKAGDRHCRWPVGDPRSPDFRFCGCTAHEGLPYCVDHARVAYQNVGKRTRGSSEERAH
ncbi:MAG: gcrA cell cycle regulator family protein [Alphaproteobacteria bacterium]|nr:gcrA cell cycle regulator family protein [Alphaproteobacteria bacterium]